MSMTRSVGKKGYDPQRCFSLEIVRETEKGRARALERVARAKQRRKPANRNINGFFSVQWARYGAPVCCRCVLRYWLTYVCVCVCVLFVHIQRMNVSYFCTFTVNHRCAPLFVPFSALPLLQIPLPFTL